MAVIWVEVQVVENFDSSMEVMKVLLNFIPFEFYGFGINDRVLPRLCWGADGDKLRIRGRNHSPGHIFVLCVCVTEFVLVIYWCHQLAKINFAVVACPKDIIFFGKGNMVENFQHYK